MVQEESGNKCWYYMCRLQFKWWSREGDFGLGVLTGSGF